MSTPDGTILHSNNRHDYVTHSDKNDKLYFLGGGASYTRSSCHGDEKHFTITSDDPFVDIRKYLQWGTYGKSGDEPLHYIKLMDITDSHLDSLLNYLSLNDKMYRYMEQEKKYRDQ